MARRKGKGFGLRQERANTPRDNEGNVPEELRHRIWAYADNPHVQNGRELHHKTRLHRAEGKDMMRTLGKLKGPNPEE